MSFLGTVGLALMLRWAWASQNAGDPAHLLASSRPVERLLRLTGLREAFRRSRSPGQTWHQSQW